MVGSWVLGWSFTRLRMDLPKLLQPFRPVVTVINTEAPMAKAGVARVNSRLGLRDTDSHVVPVKILADLMVSIVGTSCILVEVGA